MAVIATTCIAGGGGFIRSFRFFSIPTMAELGCPSEELYTSDWIGGESEALRRLPVYCQLRSRPAQNMVYYNIIYVRSSNYYITSKLSLP